MTRAMGKRWVVMRCWAGTSSLMQSQPTRYRFWTRGAAQRLADRLTVNSKHGGWYEVAPTHNDDEVS